MRGLPTLTFTELKLFLREPTSVLVVFILPLGLVMAFGLIFDPDYGEKTLATYFPAMALAMGLSQLALNMMPTTLTSYRDKRILRRMSATPIHPAKLLAAQLAVSMLAALIAAVTVIAVGSLVVGFDVPKHVPGFLAGFVLGSLALFAVGLFVAAVASSARAATGIGVVLFFVSMFSGGGFMPAEAMPATLVRIGEFTPLGATMGTLRDTWAGAPPQATQLAVLAAVTVVFGGAAARLFRWE